MSTTTHQTDIKVGKKKKNHSGHATNGAGEESGKTAAHHTNSNDSPQEPTGTERGDMRSIDENGDSDNTSVLDTGTAIIAENKSEPECTYIASVNLSQRIGN